MGLYGGLLGRKEEQLIKVKCKCWRRATQHWRTMITVNLSGDAMLVEILSLEVSNDEI